MRKGGENMKVCWMLRYGWGSLVGVAGVYSHKDKAEQAALELMEMLKWEGQMRTTIKMPGKVKWEHENRIDWVSIEQTQMDMSPKA